MALVIETGSGVADANSYGTVTGARAYAADRGITLGADAIVSAQLIKAADYLQSLSFVGTQVSDTQSLAWPRKNVFFQSGNAFPENEIPAQLVLAQYQLVVEQFNGIDIQPSIDRASAGGMIIEEKVDVLTTKWSDKFGFSSLQPSMPKVDALLMSLLGANAGRLRTLRI